jgi:hypothetical protein
MDDRGESERRELHSAGDVVGESAQKKMLCCAAVRGQLRVAVSSFKIV